MSTWVFSPSSLSISTYCVKGSFRLYFGVFKRAIIAAWLSQFMTTFFILISANIMWDAALPTAKRTASRVVLDFILVLLKEP